MKKVFAILATILLTVLLTIPVHADTAAWYQVSFTGADIWTYSADNEAQFRTDQAAPRRYRDWTLSTPVQATTYGQAAPQPLGFGDWALNNDFAFDSINLWGKGGAEAWGETYVAVAGVSSWQVVQAPTGWTSGIVLDNQLYNEGPGAFPVWRSAGTDDMLGLANMNDPDFQFTFNVLISNPLTAFDTDGKLVVFFGGSSDDLHGTGPNNYEVSGIMRLTATPVPLPGTLMLLGSGLVGLAFYRKRRAVLKG